MLWNFSEEVQFILSKAKDEMLLLNHPYIGTEHLVLSILKNDSFMCNRLRNYGLTYDKFRDEIIRVIGVGSKKSKFFLHTPLLKKVLEDAMMDSRDFHHGEVSVSDLFSSLLEEGEGIAIRIFIGMGINVDDMYNEFNSKFVKKNRKKKRKLLIDDLGVDLVGQASMGKLDPVVDREEEISRLIEILCRRGKNNPILIGEAGVGKTAIVEELAFRIYNGDVPSGLVDKKIISIDMASLVSGTKYRGEFEERMQKVIHEAQDDGNIILFIDEIHTLVGAGGAEGAIDASNILKPALARGNIRCIGATTLDEYKKYIENDRALARRFQKLVIEEPDERSTFNILKHLKPIYEKYHHVSISDDILREIVNLSKRYIFDRYNPDKSIDILDEVASMVSIRKSCDEEKLLELKKKIGDVRKRKNDLILDSDVKGAYSYLKEEASLVDKVNRLELNRRDSNKIINLEDVARVIRQKTGFPVYEIMKDDVRSIFNIESLLKKEIVGQIRAINSLIESVKKIKLGFFDEKVKSYFFVGPTGVGKTNLAKIFATSLVGNNNFIRIDMSEFSDASAVSKFIGSNPGYVGYQDHYSVIEKIKDKPNAVILLDEVDKAHVSVINLLYQILDEGEIRDSQNRVIRLHNSIIIMTSNLGYENIKVGFCDRNGDIRNELKAKFSDSLINRIDYIISFDYLKEDDIIEIVKNKLNILKDKYNDFSYDDDLVKDIVRKSEYQVYGARRVDRVIKSLVESSIIDKIINHEDVERSDVETV